MKYLVAVDPSEHALNAAEFVRQFSRQGDHVVLYTAGKGTSVDGTDAAECGRTFATKLGEPSVKVVVETKTDPRDGIVNFSRTNDVDMIIVGSRGNGILKRTVLGSVSTDVLHNSDVPVMVVHHPQLSGVQSYLVCVDGSESSHRSLQFVGRLATAECHVVLYAAFVPPAVMIAAGNVVARNPNYDYELRSLHDNCLKLLDDAKQVLKTSAPHLKSDNIIEKIDAAFEPRQAVIDFADRNNIKVLVCGTRGHGSMKRLVFGSFSSHLIHDATKHAVLVIP
jgi:nucleotide-binding universal stress UspA family protein